MRYSFVVTIFNDGALAPAFCQELERVFKDHLGKEDLSEDLEVLFVDDGSRNDSLKHLKRVADQFPFARVVALSRNFGQHTAISAGYKLARGEIVGLLNVDQEDPPDQLLVLLAELESETKDFDIVGGLYTYRDIPFFQKLTSYLFTGVLNRLTGYDTPVNAATVRVMNRRFIDAYNALSEKTRYIPGLEMWLGFNYGRVSVRHARRTVGKSSYNFRRRWKLATDSIISFSDYPLRLAVKFGFVVVVLGILLVVGLVVERAFSLAFLPGYVSTLAAIVFLGGVQILTTGLVSLYVGRVLAEVQNRPLYVVREEYSGRKSALSASPPPPGSWCPPGSRDHA